MKWMQTILAALFTGALASSPTPAAAAPAQPIELRLYKGTAPGSKGWKQKEAVETTDRGQTIFNVRDPSITAYLPEPRIATGAAVVVAPGGALRMLVLGKENQDIITRFTQRGIAVIVLKYRTVQVDRSAAPAGPAQPMRFPKLDIKNANANPDPGNEALNTTLSLATADAQAALRLVRAHAAEWKIDPHHVGMIGSSAGGGVAVGALMAGAPDATPDFIISLYGPSLQDVTVPANAPPLFLVTESNHGPVTEGLVALYAMWKGAGKPAELHIYEVPNFSMRVSLWADRAFMWMTEQNFLLPLVARADPPAP